MSKGRLCIRRNVGTVSFRTRCVPHFIGLYCSSLCGLAHGSQEGAKKEGRKEGGGGTALGLAKRRLIEAAVTVRL